MVKNNIFLAVLLASFAAPVFASNFLPKNCPVGEKGKFVVALGAVDAVSSRFTSLPRAIEFHRSNNVVPTSESSAPQTFVQKVLATEVSVDGKVLGFNGGVTVNVPSLAAKAAATYLLLEGVKRTADLVSKK